MMPTSGDCSISDTASSRQSEGTRVSESTEIGLASNQHMRIFPARGSLTEQNIIANSNVAVSPRATIFFESLL